MLNKPRLLLDITNISSIRSIILQSIIVLSSLLGDCTYLCLNGQSSKKSIDIMRYRSQRAQINNQTSIKYFLKKETALGYQTWLHALQGSMASGILYYPDVFKSLENPVALKDMNAFLQSLQDSYLKDIAIKQPFLPSGYIDIHIDPVQQDRRIAEGNTKDFYIMVVDARKLGTQAPYLLRFYYYDNRSHTAGSLSHDQENIPFSIFAEAYINRSSVNSKIQSDSIISIRAEEIRKIYAQPIIPIPSMARQYIIGYSFVVSHDTCTAGDHAAYNHTMLCGKIKKIVH